METNVHYSVLIYPRQVPELNVLKETNEGIMIGAAVTLNDVKKYLESVVHELPCHKVGILKAVLEMLKWFGSNQIRNTLVSSF